jgi:hypothetical protein
LLKTLQEILYEDFNNRRFVTDLYECPKMVEGMVLIYFSSASALVMVFVVRVMGYI